VLHATQQRVFQHADMRSTQSHHCSVRKPSIVLSDVTKLNSEAFKAVQTVEVEFTSCGSAHTVPATMHA